jgi:hypothetical protein
VSCDDPPDRPADPYRFREISTPENQEISAVEHSPKSRHVTDVEMSEKPPIFRHIATAPHLEKRAGG